MHLIKNVHMKYLASLHALEFIFYVSIITLINIPIQSFENSIETGLAVYFLRLSFGQQVIQIFIEYFFIRRFRSHVSLIVMLSLLASLVVCEIVWRLKFATFLELFIPQFFGGVGIAFYIFISQFLACLAVRQEAKDIETMNLLPSPVAKSMK